MEELENTKLFDRSRRGGVNLTPIGKKYFESSELIFSELEMLKEKLKDEEQEVRGVLSIGASDNLCNYLLPSILKQFIHDHPNVGLRLTAGTSEHIKEEVLQARAELGFFYTDVKDPALITNKIQFIEFVIVTSAEKKIKNLEELKVETFIGSRQKDYQYAYPALKMLHSLGIKPKHIIETNQQETQKKLTLAGMGYTVIPIHMVKDEIKNGLLTRLKTHSPIGQNLLMVRKKGKTLQKAAQEFEKRMKI